MTMDILSAYDTFIDVAWPYLHIDNEKDYKEALKMIEHLLELSEDTENDQFNPLIDLIATSIERYESNDNKLDQFIQEAEHHSQDIALLHTLMSQYNLTGDDIPEIGSKSMVSKVLNGKRKLNRSAIEKLCSRFDLQPSMFF